MKIRYLRAPGRALSLLGITVFFGIFVACGGRLVPARQGLAMRDVSFPMRDLRFPSGLRVIAERDSRSPNVAVALVVGSGSTSDPPGKEGLAHYVEHLTFRSRPFGKSSVKRLLERAGAGSSNAFTRWDDTTYFELGSTKTLAELLRVEGLRMMAPVMKLTPETFDVEREIVRSELREKGETMYPGALFGALQTAVFPANHPYSRPIGGTHDSISSFTPEDADAFIRKHYRASNMTLAIVGDIDLEKIQALLEETLPPSVLKSDASTTPSPSLTLSRLPPLTPEPPAPPLATPLEKMEVAVPTPQLWIAWSLPRTFDAEAFIGDFVRSDVEAQLSGAWNEDQDIAGVSVNLIGGTESSMLTCRVLLVSGDHPERSLEHVLNRLYHTWNSVEGVASAFRGKRVMESRKRAAVVDRMLDAESLVNRGIERAEVTHFSGYPALFSRALTSVEALDTATAATYAKKYLGRDRARARLFVPTESNGHASTSPAAKAPAADEDDSGPLVVDARRLETIAPRLGVNQYRQTTLANGLEVIVGQREGMPLVRAAISFHGGSSVDPAAALVATVMATSKSRYHGDPHDFGAHLVHAIDDDHESYAVEGAAGNVGIILGSLAERVRSRHVGGSRQVLQRRALPYWRIADARPEVIAKREFRAALFAGSPYEHMATPDDFESSSNGAAQTFIDRTHQPQNAVLVVVGELDPDAVLKTILSELGSWSAGDDHLPLPDALKPTRSRGPNRPNPVRTVLELRADATQSQIRIGCILPPANGESAYIRHQLTARLVTDRLWADLRGRLGITYGMYADASVLRGGTATLDIGGAVDGPSTEIALRVIKEMLEESAKTAPAARNLAWAKWRLAANHGTSFISNRAIVNELIDLRNAGFDAELMDTFATKIDAISGDDVMSDVRACLDGRVVLSVVGNEAALAAARRTFSSIGN